MLDKKIDELKPHEYDGIREYDNDLPRWWLWTFYLTIIFAAGYWFYYETAAVGGDQLERLQVSVTSHQAQYKTSLPASDDEPVFDDQAALLLMKNPALLQQTKSLYGSNCAACHGAEGQGVIGPNLTDNSWIHGGAAANIENTIRKGVVEKGMLAWEGTLSSGQIRQLVGYIISLEGTAPANAKPAEGQVYKR